MLAWNISLHLSLLRALIIEIKEKNKNNEKQATPDKKRNPEQDSMHEIVVKGLKFSLLAAMYLWTAIPYKMNTYIRRWSYLTVTKGAMHSHLYRMKLCELRKYKWNENMTIAVESPLKQLHNSQKKVFQVFNRVGTCGLCICAAVLYQLSYEDPYIENRPIYWVHRPAKGMKHKMKWCELQEYKWNEYVTIAVESQFKQLQNSLKKSFSELQKGWNLWPLHLCCSALPAELWRPIHREQVNLLSSSTHKRNITQNDTNEMNMWPSQLNHH